jgi:hypothetical protein
LPNGATFGFVFGVAGATPQGLGGGGDAHCQGLLTVGGKGADEHLEGADDAHRLVDAVRELITVDREP